MSLTSNRERRPQRLQAQIEQAATSDHNRRMAEIQALAPLLAQLDAHMPGLRALGLDLSPGNIGLTQERIGDRRMKVLRAQTGGLFGDIRRICEWLQALKALGFAEISRTEGAYPTALLRRGALLLRVDVLRQPPAATHAATHAAAPAGVQSPTVRQAMAEAAAQQVAA